MNMSGRTVMWARRVYGWPEPPPRPPTGLGLVSVETWCVLQGHTMELHCFQDKSTIF